MVPFLVCALLFFLNLGLANMRKVLFYDIIRFTIGYEVSLIYPNGSVTEFRN